MPDVTEYVKLAHEEFNKRHQATSVQAFKQYCLNALKRFDEAVKFAPQGAIIYNSRGLVYEVLNQSRNALADYSAAIYRSPNEPSFYCNRGSVHQILENFAKAKEDFIKAIELYQKKASSLLAITYTKSAFVYMLMGNYAMAKEHLKQAVDSEPSNLSLYGDFKNFFEQTEPYITQELVNSAEQDAHIRLEQVSDKTIEDINRELAIYNNEIEQINKQLALAHFKLSIVHYRLRQTDEAKVSYQQAIQLDPELQNAYINQPNFQMPAISKANDVTGSLIDSPYRFHALKNNPPITSQQASNTKKYTL